MQAIPDRWFSPFSVLLCFSLFIELSPAAAQCECEHQLRVADIFSLATASPLPLLPTALLGRTSDLPSVIRLAGC